MRRSEFPKHVRRAAWNRSGGHCECGCGQKITGVAEYDHIIPDYLEGKPILENCMVLRKKCHRRKTDQQDRPAIDKTRRVLEKRAGVRKTRRGFRKTPKGYNTWTGEWT